VPVGSVAPNHIAVSTEDGRILLYSTQPEELTVGSVGQGYSSLPLLGQVGGETAGVRTRIKDFVILKNPKQGSRNNLIVVAGSSDGTIRIWTLDFTELFDGAKKDANGWASTKTGNTLENGAAAANNLETAVTSSNRLGVLIGEYPTSSRITCLTAFMMLAPRNITKDQDSEPHNALEEEFEGFD
jgi:protein MAK11